MLFNTWTFAAFLTVVFCLYHLPPGRWKQRSLQVGLLTLASYVFYAWQSPWLILLLLASTWINAAVTVRLINARYSPIERWHFMAFAVVMNLLILVFFKYSSLLVETFLPHSWWNHWGFDLTQIPLPVGISFFTFQGISLVIDVYRNPEVVLGKNNQDLKVSSPKALDFRPGLSSSLLFFDIAFFKAFFPQLIAGPIVKAREFMCQIGTKSLGDIDWDTALRQLILGYFFKMVVADNIREATSGISYPAFMDMPGINLLTQLYAFSIQIFADFCGYSLIAMGLASLFGYRLPINFRIPYISRSITEFWRRWHISLSTWLREYLYFPLGGNRHGAARTYFNLFLVMLLGGLWHGAAWSYMVWGGAHGLLLATERMLGIRADGTASRILIGGSILTAFQILLTFNLVSLLWLLFQLPDFHQSILYVRALLAWKSGYAPQPIFTTLLFGTPVVLFHLWGLARENVWKMLPEKHPELARLGRNSVYAFLLLLIIVNSGTSGSFIYFQF